MTIDNQQDKSESIRPNHLVTVHKRVLVVGVDERSTLTVIRSLGRKGIKVDLASDNPESLCRFSKYTFRFIDLPKVTEQPEKWLLSLKSILSETVYDLVIPTADNYLIPIIKNRHRLEQFCKFAIPHDRGFEYTYDKSKTFGLAEQLQIPCPKTIKLKQGDNVSSLPHNLNFPVILKPVSSKVWKDDGHFSLKVENAVDREEFTQKLLKMLCYSDVLIQSFHPGIGVGVELLAAKGEIIAAFQHERVHEPIKGGGSSYRKSVRLSPDLKLYAGKLIKALNWTGVAMVEFKQNPDTGDVVLMEINGRFWGSLPLAVNAGMDFPYYLFDLLVNGNAPLNKIYTKNIYCRNITKDFNCIIDNLSADRSNPMLIVSPVKQIISELLTNLLFKDYFDTLARDDIRPGLKEIVQFGKAKLFGIRRKIYHYFSIFNQSYNIAVQLYDRFRLTQILKENPTVMFVCKGNICRSAFAEFYVRQIYPNSFQQVESNGFIKRSGRKSPENAVNAAKKFNVDLAPHLSKTISQPSCNSYGAIFIMDFKLYLKFMKAYPGHKNKLFYLGMFGTEYPKNIEIEDPYGKNEKKFLKTFQQIKEAIDYICKKIV